MILPVKSDKIQQKPVRHQPEDEDWTIWGAFWQEESLEDCQALVKLQTARIFAQPGGNADKALIGDGHPAGILLEILYMDPRVQSTLKKDFGFGD